MGDLAVGLRISVSVKDSSGELAMSAMQLRDHPDAIAWFVWDGPTPWGVECGGRGADIQAAIRFAYMARPPSGDGQPTAGMVRAVASAALAAVNGAGLGK